MINNEQLLINFSGYNHSCIEIEVPEKVMISPCYIIGKWGEEIVDIYLKSRNNWILTTMYTYMSFFSWYVCILV